MLQTGDSQNLLDFCCEYVFVSLQKILSPQIATRVRAILVRLKRMRLLIRQELGVNGLLLGWGTVKEDQDTSNEERSVACAL